MTPFELHQTRATVDLARQWWQRESREGEVVHALCAAVEKLIRENAALREARKPVLPSPGG